MDFEIACDDSLAIGPHPRRTALVPERHRALTELGLIVMATTGVVITVARTPVHAAAS
jgi:hypothetical protein